ncbi:MAG: gliding motility-associated-like protein [Nonlabens sp.]|jgi:gliding motility-associated-like protein
MPNIRHLNRAFNKLRRLLLIFLLAFGSLSAFSQVTTEGREFWFGFMENIINSPDGFSNGEIFITSKTNTQGTITIFANNTSVDFSIVSGQTQQFTLNDFFPNITAVTSGSNERRGIQIVSDDDISVYALANEPFSADAAVILPKLTLGNSYVVSSYYEPLDPQSLSSMLIVGTENGTEIDVTPSVLTINNRPADQTFRIILNQGDVYQLQSNIGDLTGSLVTIAPGSDGCKNFAVFGGNRWTRVTAGQDCSGFRGGGFRADGHAGDHLYEQMFPVSTLGTDYIAVPYQEREGYGLRVIATEDDTEISITGEAALPTFAKGEYMTFVFDNVRSVSSNKPIQVAQFSQSLSCDFPPGSNIPNDLGDPFMIMLSPNQQLLQEVTFNTLQVSQIQVFFANLVVRTSSVNDVFMNGVQIDPATFTTVPSNPVYSHTTVTLNGGTDYTTVVEDGFIAYIYGYGDIESFGYVAGASLANLNLQIIGDDPDINIIADEGCVNNVIDFTADFEVPAGEAPRFTEFTWDFGDGNSATAKDTVHTYTQPGEYTIILFATDGGDECGENSETITRTLIITPNEITNISGPASVCPDVNGIAYAVEGTPGNTYQWIVDGGTIVGADTGDAISVDWGAARPDASLKLISTNTLGCVADTVTFDVIINKRLEPVLPQSNGFTNTEVCFTELGDVTYSTPQTAGSEYEWFITGGDFITANNTNLVRVSWNGPGAGQIWYREFNPLISDCEGFSDRLDIIIYPEIVSTPTIMDALCNGDANGTISIALAGGKPGYTVAWSNGMTGVDINGLVAGDYTATVTDALGCEVMFTYTVAEPAILEVADNQLTDVRCFQESNGAATILVAGGTVFPNGDYIYNWTGASGFTQSTNTGTINGLRAGDYQVDIRDANGCETSTTFTINEPLLLEADIASLINDPICPQASDGTAFIDAKGGTPDYQFFWSNNPTLNDPNASGLSEGNYTVRIVDANGCETSLAIEVTERFPRIFIPNAFSPNGDGTNDEFKPVADCSITFSMQVYNKWGSVVFSTEDVSEGWDGTFNSEPAPDGKYSYVVFYAGTLNDVAFEETFRGSIKLIR